MKLIAVSNFVKRQTPNSEFSYFDGGWVELEQLVTEAFKAGKVKRGYREGVVLVEVEPERFYTSVVELKEGDKFRGEYKPRQAGEEPRKSVYVVKSQGKQPAKVVDVVLYRQDVLAENNENSCDAEWEIISINARPTTEEMPMSVDTLLANHFGASGGTATKMTNDEFVAALKRSWKYWKNKAQMRLE